MNWRMLYKIRAGLADKNVATHVVVGNERDCYGVIAYTSNEFTAYQIRREVIKDGGSNVKILPNTDNSAKIIEQEIESHFFNKVRK